MAKFIHFLKVITYVLVAILAALVLGAWYIFDRSSFQAWFGWMVVPAIFIGVFWMIKTTFFDPIHEKLDQIGLQLNDLAGLPRYGEEHLSAEQYEESGRQLGEILDTALRRAGRGTRQRIERSK